MDGSDGRAVGVRGACEEPSIAHLLGTRSPERSVRWTGACMHNCLEDGVEEKKHVLIENKDVK